MSSYDKLHNKRHDFRIPIAVIGNQNNRSQDLDSKRLRDNGVKMLLESNPKYLEQSQYNKLLTHNQRNSSTIEDNIKMSNAQ